MKEDSRILAIDPGEKNIGIAMSDPTATIARPLLVLKHVSLTIDAARIAQVARENQVKRIVVGFPSGGNCEMIPQSRHSQRLAEAIQDQSEAPVTLWDESGSTKIAIRSRIELEVPVSHRRGHQDSLAAAVILQSYLDAHPCEEEING